MRRILRLAVVLLLILPAPGLAAEDNVGLKDIIETLEKPFRAATPANEAIHDFAAEFSQLSKLVSLDREQSGHGRVEVRFQPPVGSRQPIAQFRWTYDQPNNQEIVSDGTTIWVYVPENHQVIQSEIEVTGEAHADDPMTFLTGLGNLSRDFSISQASPEQDHEGNYVLQLRPRQASALIRDLRIVVDREAVLELVRHRLTGRRLPIVSSTVTDPNGNTTTIEFSNARVNRGLPETVFNFIPPAGVEVVRPTGPGLGY